MPHMNAKRYAVVSCHVERPLDDDCWRRFSRLQERRPGGFAIAALLRPPDADAGEDAELWLERAREAAERGPLGHHTHFVGPAHARPAAGGAEHAERVRREALWLREHGLEPRLFCGGGWYMDEDVASVLAELGYADCTGTAFVPSYLDEGAPRLSRREPGVAHAPGRPTAARAAVDALARHGCAGGRARSRHTSTCTSTTRTCCPQGAGPPCGGHSRVLGRRVRDHGPRQAA